jgi:hypothetical protein
MKKRPKNVDMLNRPVSFEIGKLEFIHFSRRPLCGVAGTDVEEHGF